MVLGRVRRVSDGPDQFITLLREAGALNSVTKYQEAIIRAQSAAALNPDSPYPYCEWSRALLGLEKHNDALAMARRARLAHIKELLSFKY